MDSAPKSSKEPWDADQFEQGYNTVALEQGGHRYNKTERGLRNARDCYEQGRHVTVREFARGWFATEQRW